MKQLKLLFLLLIPYYLFAQNETEKWLEEAMAKIQENQLVGSDQSDLELDLKDWLKSPVSLNKMNANDLNKLFFLSQNQVIGILKHKEKYGPFLSVYELMAVSELDMATAKMLAKFMNVEERQKGDYESPLNWLKGGQHEIILQEAREFIVNGAPKNDDPYVGSQDHVSFRYRFAYKTKLYLGVGLEKDPGEQWGRYADFQTFHLFYKGNGLLKTLALGDFHANFGSGLNVGTSLFNGKSALVFQTSYLQSGFKPSRSFNESGYLRGIGITLQKNKVSGSFWLSASPLSAELTADTLGVFDQISSVL
ncbi:MAG: helix-hairpin-helix domain-containing protein, partial [Bacteroidia bacterium]|nr:helix-hairpin-helix domain-containing protein [Bacteroidia bacterium]